LTYRQVELRQDLGEGRSQALVTWVRSDWARQGKRVTVEGLPGVWEIVAAYEPTMEGGALAAQNGEQRDFEKCLSGG
jgi:hypothetical protein